MVRAVRSTQRPRSWVGAGLVVMALVLSSCGDDAEPAASPSPITAAVVATTTPSTELASTTVAPTTTVASRPTTTTASGLSAEGAARALFDAWMRNDRTAAAKVAEAQAVGALFARPWQAGDGWTFANCSGAAGSVICTWQRPTAEQLFIRVQNGTAGGAIIVAEVRFQP